MLPLFLPLWGLCEVVEKGVTIVINVSGGGA